MDIVQFKERIYTLSADCGISIAELLRTLGLSKGYMNSIVSRNASVSVDIAEKFADYFGVSLDYLAGREPDRTMTLEEAIKAGDMPDSELAEPAIQLSEMEYELIEHYRELSFEERLRTISFVLGMQFKEDTQQ